MPEKGSRAFYSYNCLVLAISFTFISSELGLPIFLTSFLYSSCLLYSCLFQVGARFTAFLNKR